MLPLGNNIGLVTRAFGTGSACAEAIQSCCECILAEWAACEHAPRLVCAQTHHRPGQVQYNKVFSRALSSGAGPRSGCLAQSSCGVRAIQLTFPPISSYLVMGASCLISESLSAQRAVAETSADIRCLSCILLKARSNKKLPKK